MEYYTAILVCVDINSGETFTFSRPTTCNKRKNVFRFITKEANVINYDSINTILLLENGNPSPEVIKHWRAEDGDFEDC